MSSIWKQPQTEKNVIEESEIINGNKIIIYMGCFLVDPRILGRQIPRPITPFIFNEFQNSIILEHSKKT